MPFKWLLVCATWLAVCVSPVCTQTDWQVQRQMWQSALQKMQTEPLQAAQMFHSIAETFASHAKVEVNYVTPTNTLPLHLHESALLQYAKILASLYVGNLDSTNPDVLSEVAKLGHIGKKTLRSLLSQGWRYALPPNIDGNVTHAALQYLCTIINTQPLAFEAFAGEAVLLGCTGAADTASPWPIVRQKNSVPLSISRGGLQSSATAIIPEQRSQTQVARTDIFATPIVLAQLELDDERAGHASLLRDEVVSLFQEWRAADPQGRALSNAGGGWQSQADLFASFGKIAGIATAEKNTAVRLHSVLRTVLYSAIVDSSTNIAPLLWKFLGRGDRPSDVDIDDIIIQDAWANVNGPHQYNTKHGHGHLLAGVLYVANTSGCKEDPDGGWLEFFDPRHQISTVKNQWWGHYGGFRVKPRDGMIVLFPGWMEHRVTPHRCQHERITLAFNTILRHSNQEVDAFAATRPLSLRIPAHVRYLHTVRTFQSPIFNLPSGKVHLVTDNRRDDHRVASQNHDEDANLPSVINPWSESRTLLKQFLMDPECRWDVRVEAVMCRFVGLQLPELSANSTTKSRFENSGESKASKFARSVAGTVISSLRLSDHLHKDQEIPSTLPFESPSLLPTDPPTEFMFPQYAGAADHLRVVSSSRVAVDVIFQELIVTRRLSDERSRSLGEKLASASASLWPPSIEFGGVPVATAAAKFILSQDSRFEADIPLAIACEDPRSAVRSFSSPFGLLLGQSGGFMHPPWLDCKIRTAHAVVKTNVDELFSTSHKYGHSREAHREVKWGDEEKEAEEAGLLDDQCFQNGEAHASISLVANVLVSMASEDSRSMNSS